MLLSSEQFDSILTTLRTGRENEPAPADGGGLRKSPRVPVSTRLTLIPFASGAEDLAGFDFPLDKEGWLKIPLADPLSVPIRDISRGGLRFLSPRRLPLDTPFVLLMPPAGSAAGATDTPAQHLAIECMVTYWQPLKRDLFAIGAQYIRALAPFRPIAAAPTILLPGFGQLAAA